MRILLIISLFCLQKMFADQPRIRYSFKSQNLKFELKPCDTIFSENKIYTDSTFDKRTNTYIKSTYSYPDRYYWGLYDTETNQKLYTIKNDTLSIQMKTAIISNDGQNIAIIDDYSGGFAIQELEILTFYERDKKIKSIKLGEILDNMCSVTYSASHMHWCTSNFKFNARNEFSINTNEFYIYTFDKNGQIVSKISDKNINEDDNLVVGVIKRISRNKYSVVIKFCIRGELIPNETMLIECKDREIKKIYGKLYGFLKSKNKVMKNEFTRTFLIKKSKIQKVNFTIPTYNSSINCNYLNNIQ